MSEEIPTETASGTGRNIDKISKKISWRSQDDFLKE